MRNLAVGLIVALMFGVIVFQRIEIVALKKQVTSIELSSTEKIPERNREEVVEESLSEVAANAIQESGEVVGESISRGGDSGSRMMRNFSNMMENPGFNKMMVASQKATLEVMYEGLIDHLVLDEKEEKYFVDLLLSRQMKMVEHSMNLMSGNVTGEDRKTAQEEMKAYADEIKGEVEYFLNDDEDIAEWKFYEKTMEERMALTGVEQQLGQAGLPLEEGQNRQLIETMLAEKEAFEFSNDLHDNQSTDTSAERFSQENIEAWSKDIEELDTIIARSVEDILLPEQLDVFKRSQDQMRELKLSQMNMAAQMFSKKKEE